MLFKWMTLSSQSVQTKGPTAASLAFLPPSRSSQASMSTGINPLYTSPARPIEGSRVSDLLAVKESDFPLGTMIMDTKLRVTDQMHLVERTHTKLARRWADTLSLAGPVTLARSTIQSLHVHHFIIEGMPVPLSIVWGKSRVPSSGKAPTNGASTSSTGPQLPSPQQMGALASNLWQNLELRCWGQLFEPSSTKAINRGCTSPTRNTIASPFLTRPPTLRLSGAPSIKNPSSLVYHAARQQRVHRHLLRSLDA